jgi:PTS system fructose-specific IIC component
MNITIVTACPGGHTTSWLAAQRLALAAERAGHMPVSAGDDSGAGDLVIVAASAPVDLAHYAGRPLYRATMAAALAHPDQVVAAAPAAAQPYDPAADTEAARAVAAEPSTRSEAEDTTEAKPAPSPQASSALHNLRAPRATARAEAGVEPKNKSSPNEKAPATQAGGNNRNVYRHLMAGASRILPLVVVGGLCIALSFAFGLHAADQKGSLAAAFMQIGADSAFKLMLPVLAGYIAYSIAGQPGVTPGLIGGWLATDLSAGFIGGIVAGFLGGYAALAVKRLVPLPQRIASLKPVVIMPLLASLATGLIMLYGIGPLVAMIVDSLTHFLTTLDSANAVLLGLLLGGMMCLDLGGPVNKSAYTFGAGLLASHVYLPMAALMAGGMVPPIGLGLASFLAWPKFDSSERAGGQAAIVLGLCFITEGAIPFAARDPLRAIPCCIVGGAVAGALSMHFGCHLRVPHGGLFVLLIPNAVSNVLYYLGAIAAGSLVTGLTYALIKPRPAFAGVATQASPDELDLDASRM